MFYQTRFQILMRVILVINVHVPDRIQLNPTDHVAKQGYFKRVYAQENVEAKYSAQTVSYFAVVLSTLCNSDQTGLCRSLISLGGAHGLTTPSGRGGVRMDPVVLTSAHNVVCFRAILTSIYSI